MMQKKENSSEFQFESNSRYSGSETPSGLVPESPLAPQYRQYFITENPHQTRPKYTLFKEYFVVD